MYYLGNGRKTYSAGLPLVGVSKMLLLANADDPELKLEYWSAQH